MSTAQVSARGMTRAAAAQRQGQARSNWEVDEGH